MELNRTLAPVGVLPSRVSIPRAQPIDMPNGAQLYVLGRNAGGICRLDLILHAGSLYQAHPLVARATVSMLPEGTASHSARQIAEHWDYYGAYTDFSCTADYARITIHSLTRYLNRTLPMLEEVIKAPAFPAQELHTWAAKGRQELEVMLTRPAVLAHRAFMGQLYGADHPYGAMATPPDFEGLGPAMLMGFYRQQYAAPGLVMLLTGADHHRVVARVTRLFGGHPWGSGGMPTPAPPAPPPHAPPCAFVPKANAVQSAIRVGRTLPGRDHPDYPTLVVLNAVLGGFFGSRLMRNIREEKGYTYGIGSSLGFQRHGGYLSIASEVGAQHTRPTLTEIKKELLRLCQEPIPPQELELVRAYLIGETLRRFNGPFAAADALVGLCYYNGMDYTHYDRLWATLQSVTPAQLQAMACKYLDPNSMIECVVGHSDPFG